MKRWLVLVLGSIITFGLIGIGSAAAGGTGSAASSSSGKKVLQFQTMVGVTGPFVGATNPIRGVNGGGLPWQIENASGKLSSNRHAPRQSMTGWSRSNNATLDPMASRSQRGQRADESHAARGRDSRIRARWRRCSHGSFGSGSR